MKLDCPKSLIYVKGAVPGDIGSCVYVRDALKMLITQSRRLWYPTFVPTPGEEYPDILSAPAAKLDPSEVFQHENNIQGEEKVPDESEDLAVDETGTICNDDDLE